MTMMPRIASVLSLGALLLAAPADAHEGQGPHGGIQVDAGDKHVELVVDGPKLAVYVTGAKEGAVALAEASGRAVIQDGGRTATVPLAPAEGGRLVGTAEAPIGKGARVVTSLTIAGQPVQARFVIR
jgi:hypothetical protein